MAIIVCGFPGVGKSHAFYNRGKYVISDSDSSKFKNNFPTDYVRHIAEVSSREYIDFVFVSSHEDVRLALRNAGLSYYLVMPSIDCKEEYLKRYLDRGSLPEFITLLENNFEDWVTNVSDVPEERLVVLQQGEYLADVLDTIKKNQD